MHGETVKFWSNCLTTHTTYEEHKRSEHLSL